MPSIELTPDIVNRFLAEQWPAASETHKCRAVGDRWAEVERAFNQRSVRPGGIIGGPTQFALADFAFWCASFTVLGLEPMAVTREMSIRFLRPAPLGPLVARARLESVSRGTLAGSILVYTDDIARPVSIAQGTYARPRA